MKARCWILVFLSGLLASCANQLTPEERRRVSEGELVKIQTVSHSRFDPIALALLTVDEVDPQRRDVLSIVKVDGIPVEASWIGEDDVIAVTPGPHRFGLRCHIASLGDEECPPCFKFYDVNIQPGYSYFITLERGDIHDRRFNHHWADAHERCDFKFSRRKGALESYLRTELRPVKAIEGNP